MTSSPETPSKTEDGFVAPLTLHMGEDYAVALLPNETTDTASIFFGDHTDDAFCERVVRACNAHDDLLAALNEVEDFLDNQSDVEDGDYGIPRPNRAMRLLIEVRNAITKATGVTP